VKHDALATAAEWLTHRLNEQHRKRAVAAGTRQRLINALVGPAYHREAIERYLRERCSPALVRVFDALARLPQNRPPRKPLSKSDHQLLHDALEIQVNLPRRMGNQRLASEIKKTHRRRYAGIEVGALKKRLDRAQKRSGIWDKSRPT
jgi:hypothetical protein